MAGIFSLRNWVMKQLMKQDKSGIMKIPDKNKIDFGEMLVRESLFKKGIHPSMIKNEKQLDNILDTPVVPKSERAKPKKSGKVIEVDFDKGRWNKAGGGLAKKLIQEIIRKYKGRIDDKLLNQMLVDDNPQRLAEVMATIDEALIMQQKGMKPDQIVETVKESFKRKKQAEGGRIALAAGGGLPPISGNVNFSIKSSEGSDVLQPGLTLNQKGYSGNLGGNINLPVGKGNIGLEGLLGFGRTNYDVDYQGQNVASGVGETKLGDVWNIGAGYTHPLFGGTVGISGSLDQNSNKQGNIFFRKKFALGKIVKGGNWLIKSLRGTREQLKTMNMSPGQLKYYLCHYRAVLHLLWKYPKQYFQSRYLMQQ